jgi:hypothetical protein
MAGAATMFRAKRSGCSKFALTPACSHHELRCLHIRPLGQSFPLGDCGIPSIIVNVWAFVCPADIILFVPAPGSGPSK